MGTLLPEIRPTGERAGQNIGYADDLMHKYWHFMDIGFSTDGTAIKLADPVNALTQIKLFKTALPSSSGVSDDVRSYDLVWLLHLVGDAHQPLHATARFSQDLLDGDMGGNKETVQPATGEVLLLHAYWDRMFGGYTTPQGAVLDANSDGAIAHVPVDAALATIDDPEVWFKESFEQAKKFAYAEPVLSGVQPIELTRDYETGARNTALSKHRSDHIQRLVLLEGGQPLLSLQKPELWGWKSVPCWAGSPAIRREDIRRQEGHPRRSTSSEAFR